MAVHITINIQECHAIALINAAQTIIMKFYQQIAIYTIVQTETSNQQQVKYVVVQTIAKNSAGNSYIKYKK